MGKDELVDVVNENGQYIDKEWKSVCHNKGLSHRVGAVILLDDYGRILLQRRARGKIGEGLLDFSASGHVVSGDTYENTAYREMREEIGIYTPLVEIGIPYNEGLHKQNGFLLNHRIQMFKGVYDGTFRLQNKEVSEVIKFGWSELRDRLIRDPKGMTRGLFVGLKNYMDRLEKNGIK